MMRHYTNLRLPLPYLYLRVRVTARFSVMVMVRVFVVNIANGLLLQLGVTIAPAFRITSDHPCGSPLHSF